jgi:hypothetical protein
MEDNNESRGLFNLEIYRGLGVQVPNFPENRHPAHEDWTAAQVGGVGFPVVWILAMDRDQRLELLQKFFRQLFLTAKNSLDCIDILKFGIPEEQEVAGLLESFNEAVETSKEISRYVADCARPVAEAVSGKGDASQAKENWPSQDNSFGEINISSESSE